MLEWIHDPQAWIALATLTGLEIVLGIDNIVFISVLVGRLPKEQQQFARITGLALAMGTRILLLFSLTWIMGLTDDLFTILDEGISGRDLVLLEEACFCWPRPLMRSMPASKGRGRRREVPGPGPAWSRRSSRLRSSMSCSLSTR